MSPGWHSNQTPVGLLMLSSLVYLGCNSESVYQELTWMQVGAIRAADR